MTSFYSDGKTYWSMDLVQVEVVQMENLPGIGMLIVWTESSEDKIGGPIDTLKLGIVEGASEHDEIVLVNTCYESPIHPDPHGTWTQQLAFRQFENEQLWLREN
jgi:hypothetical protein